MKRALLLFVAACDVWQPTDFPVPVQMDTDLTPEQVEVTINACEVWNHGVGREVLHPTSGDHRRHWHAIHVKNSTPRPGENAGADMTSFSCAISIGTAGDVTPDIVEHEIGHCILPADAHDYDDPGSIMYPWSAPQGYQVLRDDDLAYVRQLVDRSW